MALTSDLILDRRRLKTRLGFWRVVAVLALAAAVVLALSLAGVGLRGPLELGHHIALVKVEGLIVDDRDRAELLAEIAENDAVRAVIVRIDSPGGTVVGGQALYAQLREVAEAKPVVAVMGEMATSAAYMIALGGDHIVARPGTITGSIGVLLQSADITGLLDSIGIKPELIKSDPLKAQPNPLEPLTDTARAALRSMIEDVYQQFVDLVAARRGFDPETARNVSDGRVYTGHQAVELGLIDALGGEEEAREWLVATHGLNPGLRIRTTEPRRDPADVVDFLSQLVGNALFSDRLRLDGLVSVWHVEG